MPTTTPLMKVNRTRSYGAEVVLHGDVFDEALAYANELAAEHGYTFIHPFNDLDVATGQGTIAMGSSKSFRPLIIFWFRLAAADSVPVLQRWQNC